MMRLSSSSSGRGQPFSVAIAEWAAANPKVRRVWASGYQPEDTRRQGDSIDMLLELEPVADSEETLTAWIAHGSRWRKELEKLIGMTVELQWADSDAEGPGASGSDGANMLVYERAR